MFQMLSFGLKVDGIIEWTWDETFCSYWILFYVLIGMTMSTFLLMGSKIIDYYITRNQFYELIGFTWLFFFSGGFTVTSRFALYGTIEFLLDQTQESIFKTSFGSFLVFQTLMVVLTWMFRGHLTKFFALFAEDSAYISNVLEELQAPEGTITQPQPPGAEIPLPVKLSLPQYMVTFSLLFSFPNRLANLVEGSR